MALNPPNSPSPGSPEPAPPVGVSSTPKRRNLLSKLVLLVSSVLVALLVLEVVLRLFGLSAPLVWAPDPEVGWHHIPGARTHWTEEGDGLVQINRLGYRDRERQL